MRDAPGVQAKSGPGAAKSSKGDELQDGTACARSRAASRRKTEMPEYLTPGVYIEEIGGGPRPIEGVPTSTAAFVGETERGHLCPRLVTSYNEYERWFGSVFKDGRYMPDAVSGFFENGGKRLYVPHRRRGRDDSVEEFR